MDRRRFLLGLAGGGAALVGRASAQDGPVVARLGVDYEDAGRTIARDFIGLSYESAVVAANDFFTADNRTLLRLLRTLGSQGVLRASAATPANARYGGRRTPRRHAKTSSSRRSRSIASRASCARLAGGSSTGSTSRPGRLRKRPLRPPMWRARPVRS
jgi:hypothetical protein